MRLKYHPEIDGLRTIVVGAVIPYNAKITIFGHQPFKGAFLKGTYWKTKLILL